ncbi:MAG: cytochrome P450 [Thermodesulfobacteriota bacterium]
MPETAIPQEDTWDSTPAFFSEGYRFISNRCARMNTDVFDTRIMFKKATCVTGEDAARMFYHPDRFTRQGAIPPTTVKLLQDKGSVQTLSGNLHRHRKKMFMSLMSTESIQRLVRITEAEWHQKLKKWEGMDRVVLHPEVQEILTRSVCRWAGIPLSDSDAKKRTHEFAAMIEGAGTVGPRNWLGLVLRARSERWGRGFIRGVRKQKVKVLEGSAADVTAWYRNPEGDLLDDKVAAVELINFLRPTVAVARYIAFAALALHQHPDWRRKLQSGADDDLEMFAQEVRRFYPYFPAVAGRVQIPFTWRGRGFKKGDWIMLDLYGTNRDPRSWKAPDTFDPERFRKWDESPFNFIPQGAGNHDDTHRCPGEWITIELIKNALSQLTGRMRYDVPQQNHHIDLSRIPAITKSRFIITHVRSA